MLLFALLLITVAAAQDTLLLPVYEQQYVTLYVGSRQREVVMRLRWDLDELVLYTPPQPSEYSTSFWQDSKSCDAGCRGSEVFYLGSQQLQLQVLYAPQGALWQLDPLDTSQHITHHGLLPMGLRSPLWRHWHSWTWSRLFLQLGGTVQDALRHTAPVVQVREGTLRGCWADDRCVAVSLRPQQDYSFASIDTYTAWLQDESWSLRVWNNESLEEDELMLHMDALASDYNGMVTDQLYLGLPDAAQEELQLGLMHLSGWILSYDVVAQQLWLAALPSWFVREQDYLLLVVGVMVLLVVWYPGVYEHIHVARWHRNQRQYLLRRLPPEQLKALLWMTRLLLWLLVATLQWCLRPYLLMRLMQHPYATVSSRVDAIYATQVVYVLWTSVSGAEWNRDLVLHMSSAILLCAWQLVVLQFHRTPNAIAMLSFSGVVFVLQADLLLWLVYRRQRQWLSLLFSAVCTTAAAWFFALYNMELYLQQRWPNHPSAIFIELFSLATVWYIVSFHPFAEEHAVQYRANVTREFAKLEKLLPAQAAAAPAPVASSPYSLLGPQGRVTGSFLV
jgi:hypothetical protein